MLGGEVSGGCEQEVIKALGSGWNAEILAELGFLEMEVPEAGGREEASSWASDSHREQPRAPSAKVPALHPCRPLGLPPCWPPTVGGSLGHQLYPSALRLKLPVVLASWLSLRRVTHLCGEH